MAGFWRLGHIVAVQTFSLAFLLAQRHEFGKARRLEPIVTAHRSMHRQVTQIPSNRLDVAPDSTSDFRNADGLDCWFV